MVGVAKSLAEKDVFRGIFKQKVAYKLLAMALESFLIVTLRIAITLLKFQPIYVKPLSSSHEYS